HVFATHVLPPVRAFLKDNQLEEQVTCLVTFYGVPLRVAPRANTAEQQVEFRIIQEQIQAATAKAKQAVAEAENVAKQATSDFDPPSASDELPALSVRAS